MDFSTRNNQQSPAAPRPGTTFAGGDAPASRKQDSRGGKRLVTGKWAKWGGLLLLVAVAVLVLAVIWILINGNGAKAESSYVDSNKLQAVFLTNDQVYFGNITALNGKYVALSNIYYLQTQNGGTNQAAAANNVSLVKLGCELHKPFDQMVINRSEVEFWENLQGDGQVANAVKQYKQQNPGTQKCSNTTSNSTTNVQGSTSTAPATSSSSSTNKNQ